MAAHALVFGASGVSGWALAREALQYPTKDTFQKVTALTNRPLSHEDSMLPSDPRLQLASGVDLTASVSSVVAGLKEKVSSIETVTHVFFTAYIEKPDYDSLREVNTELLKNAISAVEQLAPNLEAVILQTGGKAYGVEFTDKPEINLQPPLSESLPRIPKPYYDNIFYYAQYDLLQEMSKGKKWSFQEVRPDVIVGFTPGTNFMNVTQGLAFYLTLYREVHGEGSEVPFIGTAKSWKCKHMDSFQDVLAKQELYLATHQGAKGVTNGASFNSSDGPVVTWEQKWPGICQYFGLKGTGPAAKPTTADDYKAFAEQNEAKWESLVSKHKLKQGLFEKYAWKFLDAVSVAFDFDRQYDLSAIRNTGFTEEIDTVRGYTTSFDRMRAAHIIP